MTEEHPFELDPPGPESEAGAPVPRRKRAPAGPRRRQGPRTPAATEADETPRAGWLARLTSPLVSPTAYYIFGFLSVVGLALCLFNPKFGAALGLWPHEVLGSGPVVFMWSQDAVRVVCLTVVVAAYVIALLMRPGAARATVVVVASFLAYVTFEGAPANLHFYLLPVMLALTVGALLSQPPPGRNRTARRVLLIGLALLATHLFLPWDSGRVAERRLPAGYYCTALSTVDLYVHPPEEYFATPDPYAPALTGGGYPRLVMSHLQPTVACLLFLVGLLALLGLGRAWARWAAGSLLVFACVGTIVVLYLSGRDNLMLGTLPPWQRGLSDWANAWHQNYLAYALPLAGAVAELVGGRRS